MQEKSGLVGRFRGKEGPSGYNKASHAPGANKSSQGVCKKVPHRSKAARDKGLMDFVQGSPEDGNRD